MNGGHPSLDGLLERFAHVTLEETLRVRLFDRVDTKYIIDLPSLLVLLPRIISGYSVLREFDTSLLHYRNIYFDTCDRSMYLDHHNGRSMRFKVRLREYSEFRALFLEVKRKYKGKTTKQRVSLGSGVIEDLFDGKQMLWPSETPELIRSAGLLYGIPSLVGVMSNEFARITLLNHTRTERITIDLGISFKKYPERDPGTGLDGVVVVEVKQERASGTSHIHTILREMGFHPSGMSKYCIGTIRLLPEIKYNAFKETNNRIARYTHAIQ